MMNNKTQEGERRNLFTDDLTFALVMRDEAICKGLLERIIPETGKCLSNYGGKIRNWLVQ